jgi:hypothetical protein
VGILLVISFSHMTMPAKCSPLEEPVRESQIRDKTGECFKHDSDERVDADLKNKDKRCDKQEPDLFRSSVRVQGEIPGEPQSAHCALPIFSGSAAQGSGTTCGH